jgi:hypothetical protein
MINSSRFFFINNEPIRIGLGKLQVFEIHDKIPFEVKRVFTLVDNRHAKRGKHAHKITTQALQILKGKVRARITGEGYESLEDLDDSKGILVIPPMNWLELDFLVDSVIIVFASSNYDESEYIRDFSEFRRQIDE